MLARSVATPVGPTRAPERPVATPAVSPKVVVFGSARPVTCAVMDYVRRLHEAIEAQRPGFVAIEIIEPSAPIAFVAAVARVLRAGGVAHFELPIEGWGNSVVPGSALMAARLLTRRGRIAVTMHEWASLNLLRYLSTIPDLLAADGFIAIFLNGGVNLGFERIQRGLLSVQIIFHPGHDAVHPVVNLPVHFINCGLKPDDLRMI